MEDGRPGADSCKMAGSGQLVTVNYYYISVIMTRTTLRASDRDREVLYIIYLRFFRLPNYLTLGYSTLIFKGGTFTASVPVSQGLLSDEMQGFGLRFRASYLLPLHVHLNRVDYTSSRLQT